MMTDLSGMPPQMGNVQGLDESQMPPCTQRSSMKGQPVLTGLKSLPLSKGMKQNFRWVIEKSSYIPTSALIRH